MKNIFALKSTKSIVSIAFALAILFGNTLPVLALDLNTVNSSIVEKSDSTDVQTVKSENTTTKEKKSETSERKSTTRITYNIIYYLIAKFILLNPFNRPS